MTFEINNEERELRLANKLINNVDSYNVVTHKRIDTDALMSIVLIMSLQKDPKPIELVTPSTPINGEFTIGLDLDGSENTIKGREVGSCFGVLCKALIGIDNDLSLPFKELAKFVNQADSGEYPFRSQFDPPFLIRYWRAAGLDDIQMIEQMSLIMRGIIEYQRQEIQNKYFVEDHVKFIKHCGIAVNPPAQAKVHKWVFKRRKNAYIFFNENKGQEGIGVIINRDIEKEGFSFINYKKKFPETWIIMNHMAFYGSKKNPKDPNKSGISLDEFIKMVNEIIDDFLEEA